MTILTELVENLIEDAEQNAFYDQISVPLSFRAASSQSELIGACARQFHMSKAGFMTELMIHALNEFMGELADKHPEIHNAIQESAGDALVSMHSGEAK